ncbi:hypothetical protein BJ741DRAFT_29927 [Chytriomyces cf. hyalinus JEL632]|nr:hypothetical protein BJ741DRAFT_29927 [Chytriomyces cf. hyalinus JEL632]
MTSVVHLALLQWVCCWLRSASNRPRQGKSASRQVQQPANAQNKHRQKEKTMSATRSAATSSRTLPDTSLSSRPPVSSRSPSAVPPTSAPSPIPSPSPSPAPSPSPSPPPPSPSPSPSQPPSPSPSPSPSPEPSPSPQPSPSPSQQPSPSPRPSPSPQPPSPPLSSQVAPPPETSAPQQSPIPAPSNQPAPTTDAPNISPIPRPDVTTANRDVVVETSSMFTFTSNGATFTSKTAIPVPTVSGRTISTVNSTISENSSNGGGTGSSTGVIIGVIAGIAGVLLICGGVLWWRRINKPKSRRYNLDDLFSSPSANAQTAAGRPFSITRPNTATSTPPPPSSDVNLHETLNSEYSAVPVRSSVDFSQSQHQQQASHHQHQLQQPSQFLMADGSNHYMNAQSQQHAQAYYDAATLAYYQQQQAAYYQQYGQYPPAEGSYDAAQLQMQHQQYAAAYANQAAASSASDSGTQSTAEEKNSHMFDVYDHANVRFSAAPTDSTDDSTVVAPPTFVEKERLLKPTTERGADANQWTTDEAVAWVAENEYGTKSTVTLMKEQEIDGRSLLLLSNHDLENTLKITDAKKRDRFEDAISELKQNSASLQQASSSGLPSYD